jgi:hypothetical protein
MFMSNLPLSLLLAIASHALLAFLIIYSNYSQKAFAHETFDFGNFTITPGWQTEPPLVNQLNSVEISVAEKASGSADAVPVRNAFSNLEAGISSGGLTKPLDLQPQEESAGLYRALIIPTQVGSYSLVLSGKIENQTINAEVPIEDVEDIRKFAFPIQEGGGLPQSSQLSEQSPSQQQVQQQQQQQQPPELQQLSPLISDLITEINETNNRALRAENIAQSSLETIEQLKISVDRAYVFGMVAIGIGLAAVIVGGVALSRKSEQAINRKR